MTGMLEIREVSVKVNYQALRQLRRLKIKRLRLMIATEVREKRKIDNFEAMRAIKGNTPEDRVAKAELMCVVASVQSEQLEIELEIARVDVKIADIRTALEAERHAVLSEAATKVFSELRHGAGFLGSIFAASKSDRHDRFNLNRSQEHLGSVG